ncbi:MAG: bifunctional phosphoribosylaminoimidazolecarboxamide formyltransferase/inosine monophosphate cyclohydrolase, partial [Calditrichaeota bacterium]
MNPTRNVLLSVTDKTGIAEFARHLTRHGYQLYSTGGTAAVLKQAGLQVREVSDLTEFPEIMGGRVKTLHPRVFGGILADADQPGHLQQAEAHGIPLFDMVVVNLYAFREAVSRQGISMDEAVEQIDIGGVALIRAAAKNFKHVAVVTSPDQYPALQEELD